jgi:hypothetical protein
MQRFQFASAIQTKKGNFSLKTTDDGSIAFREESQKSSFYVSRPVSAYRARNDKQGF